MTTTQEKQYNEILDHLEKQQQQLNQQQQQINELTKQYLKHTHPTLTIRPQEY